MVTTTVVVIDTDCRGNELTTVVVIGTDCRGSEITTVVTLIVVVTTQL